MRRIIAALAAILVTLSLTVVSSGSAVAGHDHRPTVGNPFEPKPYDICSIPRYKHRCKDKAFGENPFEPKPYVQPQRKGLVIRDGNPIEAKPYVRR